MADIELPEGWQVQLDAELTEMRETTRRIWRHHRPQTRTRASSGPGVVPSLVLTPSADLPACRDEDPGHAATLAACYPDPPEYQHPDGDPQ